MLSSISAYCSWAIVSPLVDGRCEEVWAHLPGTCLEALLRPSSSQATVPGVGVELTADLPIAMLLYADDIVHLTDTAEGPQQL